MWSAECGVRSEPSPFPFRTPQSALLMPASTNIRWHVFSLACGTSWLLYLHRYSFALIKPELEREWGLNNTQLGWLDSAFFTPYALFQFPLGLAADAWGVRYVLAAMILVWSLGMALHAWAGSPGQMWYARAVLGLGQSAAFAALARLSRQWFPRAIRTTLQGFVNVLAGRAGGISANLIFASLLIGAWGLDWRSATYVLVVIGVLQGLAVLVFIRNSPHEHARVNADELSLIAGTDASGNPQADAMPLREVFRRLDTRGMLNLAALSIQMVLSTMADNIYSNWIPAFLFQVHRLKYAEMGIYSSLPLLGGAVAGVLGGVLNDLCLHWTGNRRWSRSGVAATGKTLAALVLFAALAWYDSPYVFCGLLFVVKLFGDWSLTTMVGVSTDIGGPATASVYALTNTIAATGTIFAPVLIGAVADNWGWSAVFVAVGVTYLLCAASWLVIDCTIPLVRERERENE